MRIDFHDACLRHFDDAERLFEVQRWANADHLFGISVECGLKCLMAAFGMKMEGDRPAEKADRVHTNRIWERYEAYRSGHGQGAHYALGADGNPFQNWDINQRYVHQGEFDHPYIAPHRAAAQEIRGLLKRAERDGFL
ncbi:hypothetical protein [Rhodospirillum rubrum]|uniref:SAM-dependent methyltransferase n=2 Tax=Rhodospirillum rubrum TaxID=1085 RepID=Q2RQ05_RHORT|nr:hypothetical protein [Rhodospirillum rubrum]AAN75026.1 unknown [Rhodospirillum rubrum ATCC 11170]ABC23790.1 hypothetical protein Rru_A2995 [Rhodospirillum rubrum ATCC 11170]MBK5955468.1 SAM-dependent methyltransferase [Rhodospirillum rubrum]QXG79740.1 SAM-dependent methyltransferase [Rhodospirillum rubrum]